MKRTSILKQDSSLSPFFKKPEKTNIKSHRDTSKDMLRDMKSQLKEMNSKERPDIKKMIELEQQKLQNGQTDRKKTDIRELINSENIIKQVHFLNIKQ